MTGSPTPAPGPGIPPGGTGADERTRDALLIGLTLAAGVVDAVSYLGLGEIFTANMTGNVVFMALAVGQRSLLTALRSAAALTGFCGGAIVAGRFLLRPRPPGPWPRRATWVLCGVLACMTAFAGVWAAVDGRPGATLLYLLIGLSSFGMGLQNAVARHLAVPGLTTTVITTALTGFMVDLPALGISGPAQRRGGLAVLFLFAGAAVGAACMVGVRALAPFLTVGAVAGVAVAAYRSFPAAKGPGS
ncbi:MAG TPA: YoaK family protein [Thermoplasmata archaeon]|nr:YoaK family protein [Thermoplasmata archaeon]